MGLNVMFLHGRELKKEAYKTEEYDQLSDSFFDECSERLYDFNTMTHQLIMTDETGSFIFAIRLESKCSMGIWKGDIFSLPDFNIDSEFLALEEQAFQKMLNDPETPAVFRSADNWSPPVLLLQAF